MTRSSIRSYFAATPLTALLVLAAPAEGQCPGELPDTDCNANGIPDACELTGLLTYQSGPLSPVDSLLPQEFTIDAPPEAMEDLIITFRALGDLSHWSESISVYLNDDLLPSIFVWSMDCQEDTESYALSRDLYMAAAATGQVRISFVPTAAVGASLCGNSYIEVDLEIITLPGTDENANGVLDECEQEDESLCMDLEPTVFVDEDGFIVGGLLDGRPYFGLLIGTRTDDVLLGTEGCDVILAWRGHDTVCAGAGRDLVLGGSGNDVLNAGPDNDRMYGGSGHDTLCGDEGFDRLKGGSGDDSFCDDDGEDYVIDRTRQPRQRRSRWHRRRR